MKLNQCKIYIRDNFRGKLPTTVFVWQLILGLVCAITVLLVSLWYYKFYTTSYGGSVDVAGEQYEEVIDKQKLEDILKSLNLIESSVQD